MGARKCALVTHIIEAGVSDRSLFTASGRCMRLQKRKKKRRKKKSQTPSWMPQPAPIKADTIHICTNSRKTRETCPFGSLNFTQEQMGLKPEHFSSCCYTLHTTDLKTFLQRLKQTEVGVGVRGGHFRRDLSSLTFKGLRGKKKKTIHHILTPNFIK